MHNSHYQRDKRKYIDIAWTRLQNDMFMTTHAFFVYTRITICTKQFSISSHGVEIQKYTWFGKPPLIRKRQCYTHGIWQNKERYTTQNCARCEIKQNLRWENNLIEKLYKLHIQCDAVITWSIFSKIVTKDNPTGEIWGAICGFKLSFVFSVTAVMCEICYIGSR